MEVTLPMLSSMIPQGGIKSYYIVDLSNAPWDNRYVVQATQVIALTPSMDLPSGSLYVYRNDKLEASTYLPATGKDQEREISLLQIPAIFSTGTTVVDTMEKLDQETKVDKDTITLEGTLRNGLSIQAMVYIRYRVETAKVVSRGISNGVSYRRQGPYLLFPHPMTPNSTQAYSHTFTIQH